MSRKKYRARDKSVNKLTRDGLAERNAATGVETLISKRETELDLRRRNAESERYSQVGNTLAKKRKKGKYHKPEPIQTTDNQTVQQPYESQSTNTPQKFDTVPTALHHDAADAPRTQVKPPGAKKQKTPEYTPSDTAQTPPDTPAVSDARSQPEPHAADPPQPRDTPQSALKTDKPGKLQFSQDETVSNAVQSKPNRKLTKAEHGVERAADKLEKAKDKLPAKRKIRTQRVFDEKTGKAKRKLSFEKEDGGRLPVKSQSRHMKGALPLRPVKTAGNALMLNAHRKIYQVEHENVGVKTAHRAEMVAEGGIRSALHFRKTAPYNKTRKLERTAAKNPVGDALRASRGSPRTATLTGNIFSRMAQKRKIKKDYAKAARQRSTLDRNIARGARKIIVPARGGRWMQSLAARHPVAAAVIVLLALLLFALMSLFSVFSGAGSGAFGGILTASYLAEDADIDNAELSYTEWETDLQFQINRTESDYPGYDEYRYNIGDISHNPYELMAYLTVMYQNFPYDAISGELRALFDEQYTLTYTPSVETRYADPSDTDDDGDYEPYEWKILTVTLTSQSFGGVIIPRMDADQLQHYSILMQTKGSRQYLGNPFGDMDWLPYVTSYYGWRVHPISGAKDLHRAVDIGLPTGTEIYSGQDGTVTFAGYSGAYGNVVVIENDKGLVSKYAHCDTLFVSAGQTVTMGDVIATVGSTGNSTGSHLHLEVMKNGIYANSLYFADTGSYNTAPVFGIPGEPMGDGTYASLIAEAEKHLGKPYVFGSNGPNSFDCSSFICYIFTQSGVKNISRTTAQGIYNQCTPIPESERQPGDVVFFHSTYSTSNTVTHVALYVGNGWIIHAGSPIQHTQIDGNPYWQAHLYSYGRLAED